MLKIYGESTKICFDDRKSCKECPMYCSGRCVKENYMKQIQEEISLMIENNNYIIHSDKNVEIKDENIIDESLKELR